MTDTNLTAPPDRPRTYSALNLLGECYLGLFNTGVIPPGPMPDPEGAQRACADLLRAFGVTPTETTCGARQAARTAVLMSGDTASPWITVTTTTDGHVETYAMRPESPDSYRDMLAKLVTAGRDVRTGPGWIEYETAHQVLDERWTSRTRLVWSTAESAVAVPA